MDAKRMRSNLMLLLTAFIWGVAFVAQSVGMDYVGPFTFNAVRSVIGGVVLIPCIFLIDRFSGAKSKPVPTPEQKRKNLRTLILGGVCCGAALAVGSNLQQIGIAHTTVGKAGFITALYIIIVPIFNIFLGKKAPAIIWVSVALAVAGMYLLCITEGFSISKGDFLVLLCAVGFSVHILVIDYFSPMVDGVRMSCIQFFVSGLISSVLMFLFEQPQWSSILAAWAPVLYAGMLSCGVAYTLQVVAQKNTDPVVASLILSLESVLAVLAGWALLGQALSLREIGGCVLVFCAIILAQLPSPKKKQRS